MRAMNRFAQYSGHRNFARVLTGAVLVITAGCHDCNGDPERPPAVTSLEIYPGPISAVENSKFTLLVRGRDADGNLVSNEQLKDVQWSTTSANTVLTPTLGASITVAANAGPETIPREATLTAKLTGVFNAKTTINIVPSGTSSGKDWIIADYSAGETPAVALIDGMSSTWNNDATLAFAGEAALPDYIAHCDGANCGEVVLFSPRQAVMRVPFAWKVNCDLVRVSTSDPPTACNKSYSTPVAPRRVALKVWIAATGSDVQAIASADLDYAVRILRNGRSGLDLGSPLPTPTIANPTDIMLDLAAPDWICPMDLAATNSVIKQLEDVGVPASTFSKDEVNVVYVDALTGPPVVDSYAVDFFGYTCPWDASRGSIVLISASSRKHTTLPHELGHALGPWESPDYGHTKRGYGFDESNLMWPYESDYLPVSREMVTLGQAFQISLGSGSILNRLDASTGIKCQTDPMVDVPCPLLAKDIRE